MQSLRAAVDMRLFFGNFDFELRLASEGGIPASVRRLNAEMASVWLAVVSEGDALWCPEVVETEFWERMRDYGLPRVIPVSDPAEIPVGAELCPWGWNDEVLQWAAKQGVRTTAPPLDVVRRANSRRFSFERETRTGSAPAGAAMCRTVEELRLRVTDLGTRRWVVKAEFSQAARERVLGAGSLTVAAESWARRRLERDGVVFVEPWLDRVAEMGVQWTIRPDDEPKLEGITSLLTHPDGRYLGSQFAGFATEGWMTEAIDGTRKVAADLARQGYFGPVGIDSMLYRRGGELAVRPLQDVNARWTMGRLSLGWAKLMRGEKAGVWFHAPIPEGCRKQAHRTIVTTPAQIGGISARHCTTVWVGEEFSP